MANPTASDWTASFAAVESEPQRVTVRRAVPTTADLEADLRKVQALAKWMDSRFSIAGFRVGFDSLIGLVPGVGDTVSAAIALYPLWVAHKHNLGAGVKARMGLNVLADWAAGLVPLVGDLVDVALKANLRNAAILEKAVADQAGVR